MWLNVYLRDYVSSSFTALTCQKKVLPQFQCQFVITRPPLPRQALAQLCQDNCAWSCSKQHSDALASCQLSMTQAIARKDFLTTESFFLLLPSLLKLVSRHGTTENFTNNAAINMSHQKNALLLWLFSLISHFNRQLIINCVLRILLGCRRNCY